MPLRGLGGGDAEQADLGRGVEAEPEQEPERVHVPADRETTLNSGRNRRASKPRPASSASRSSSTICSPRRARAKAAQMPRRMNRLARPMTSRNSAETAVPMTPPMSWKASSWLLQGRGRRGDGDRGQDHDGRVAEREEEADRQRLLAFLHQLAHDIVDGRDVVGIERMPQAERVGQKRGAQQQVGRSARALQAQAQAAMLAAIRPPKVSATLVFCRAGRSSNGFGSKLAPLLMT